MTLQSSVLRRQAEERLARAAYSPRRLVLIHTGVSLGASLLLALVNYLFYRMIEGTGGLGGLGIRSLLETAQVLLETAVSLLLPFWNIGLIRAVLCWTRGESAQPSTLLEGFRRVGSVMGMALLTAVVFIAIGFATINVSGLLIMFTPFSQKMMEVMTPLLEAANAGQDPAQLMTDELAYQIVEAAIPMLIFWLVLFVALCIPVLYRLRFSEFALMDGKGPFASLLESLRLTRGAVWQLVKLDLSFWWFYLLQFLTVAISYAADIMTLTAVTLPISADLAFFLCYTLGIVCQGLLLWGFQAKVSTTYALAYEALAPTSRS